MKLLTELVAAHKQDSRCGIFAVCSAHPLVLEAALRYSRDNQTLLLVEATSNQVDQYGGYTGMTPAVFRDALLHMADAHAFPRDKLILGGDHLGPNRWQSEPARQAMEKAQELIKSYVAAGFKKIHLDCSMPCRGDPVPLTDDIVAQRAATLASVAEKTCIEHFGVSDLAYVIGTEVPIPGGAHETLTALAVTSPNAAQETLKAHQSAFAAEGLTDIWPRVIGLVVQPGVEFDNANVIDYQREKSKELSEMIKPWQNLVFEAHSTDYQNATALRELVEDHFAILKVGPALTFALRETLFALAAIEKELLPEQRRSHLRETLESVMLHTPKNWQNHYEGDSHVQRLARGFSYSDRIRYYWPDEQVEQKVEQLMTNLTQQPIPVPLLSQYLPVQSEKVRKGELMATPHELIIDSIQNIMRQYDSACRVC